jgi:putative redox protein
LLIATKSVIFERIKKDTIIMKMEITFDGKKRVNASYNGITIKTDQPAEAGGDASAPAPFDLFLASIGTCAGIYVKSFCDQRNISPEGISITQDTSYNMEKRLVDAIKLEINVPQTFPEKYVDALINVANLCAVKKHLLSPPEITVSTKVTAA